jgi:riboflavin biosynthesis pyrimidine reductase
MRALLPSPLDDVDVHAFYAENWLEPGGVRMNFVASVDGAATAAGLSRGLQTPGDNRIFAALRDLADVVVAGAGTVRAEGYQVVRLSARRTSVRERYGLAAELPTAVISRSLNLDPASALFAADGPRTVVITCAAADPVVLEALRPVADIAICGADEVDLGAARAALEDRGFRRVLCEGGPHLFADMLRADVVDELCLSVSPLLAGPGAGRIVSGVAWASADGVTTPQPVTTHLAGLLEEDGALFCRYLVPRRPTDRAGV